MEVLKIKLSNSIDDDNTWFLKKKEKKKKSSMNIEFTIDYRTLVEYVEKRKEGCVSVLFNDDEPVLSVHA